MYVLIEKADRKLLKELVFERGQATIAEWIGCSPSTVNNWLKKSKTWKEENRDAIRQHHAEFFSTKESTLRKLYTVLKNTDAGDTVLGTVARFILEEEG